MKSCSVFLLLTGIVLQACKKQDEPIVMDSNGVVIRLPHLWKSSTSLNGSFVSNVNAQITYRESYILTGQRTNEQIESFALKSLEDGRNKWVWRDPIITTEDFYLGRQYAYSYQKLLLYNNGPRSYCIDLETGKSVWRKQWTSGISRVITTTGYGDQFYFTGTPPELWSANIWEESIYQGDLRTGQIRPIAKLASLPGQFWPDPSGLKVFATGRQLRVFTHQTDTLVLASYDLPVLSPQFNTPMSGYLSLYNISKKQWVYEQIPLLRENEAGGGNYPIIVGDNVYFAINMWVGCFDLWTSQRRWMRRVTEASLFGDLRYTDGKLLANGQDAKLYCLDPQTGAVLWTQKSSALYSAMHTQDGVVYYIASKNLLAVDIATGKLLWDLPCPDAYTENRKDSWFAGFVTGLPGKNGQKGRIFASTNLNVYAFEAAR